MPPLEEIERKISEVRNCDFKDLQSLREYLSEVFDKFVKEVEYVYDDTGFIEPDEIIESRMRLLHLYNGGLLGLALALKTKVKSEYYQMLIEEDKAPASSDKKIKKLTASDREEFARGETATEEGILKALEVWQYNISGKIASYRPKR